MKGSWRQEMCGLLTSGPHLRETDKTSSEARTQRQHFRGDGQIWKAEEKVRVSASKPRLFQLHRSLIPAAGSAGNYLRTVWLASDGQGLRQLESMQSNLGIACRISVLPSSSASLILFLPWLCAPCQPLLEFPHVTSDCSGPIILRKIQNKVIHKWENYF